MTNLLIYLLKAGAWLVPFYLLYLLLFRRFSFYSLNRVYLLVAIVASFALPFVNYTILVKKEIQVEHAAPALQNIIPYNEIEATAQPQIAAPAPAASINFMEIITILYLTGVAFMLFRLARNLFSLFRIIHSSEKEKMDNLWLVYAPAQTGHASFFSYILLDAKRGEQKDLGLVVAHEKIHVQRRHSFDILLCELMKVLHWFNPFVWLYKKSLCELHEFEADALSTQQTNKKDYAASLLHMAVASRRQITSQFSRHPLKTRITRLFKPQTPDMKKLLFLLVLPVTVAVLIAFKSINRKTVPVWVNAPLVVMVDAGHGGDQPGVQAGEVTEKNLTLSIAEKVKQQAEAAGMKVIMTRTADVNLSVNERIEMAVNAKPDILVSVHINGGKPADENGIELYAGANNNPAHAKASETAASGIIQSLSGLEGIYIKRPLKSRSENIGILKRVNCPAVLIECGYLTNASDLDFIISSAKQDELAQQIVKGLLKYAEKRNAPMGNINVERPVVPLEAKVINLYAFSPDGTILLDNKVIDHALLADINPARIAMYKYFEPGNEHGIHKYGELANNGLLRLYTFNNSGQYAFADAGEKEKWMEVARAHRRVNTAEKYDRFTYTEIDGKRVEVVVIAGGKNTGASPDLSRMAIYSAKDEKLKSKYIVDSREVSEPEFRHTMNKLNAGDYEWVSPWLKEKVKKNELFRIEIKKLPASTLIMPDLWNKIAPKPKPGNSNNGTDGC